MKRISLILLLLLLFIPTVSAEVFHYYVIDLIYNHGNLSYTDLRIEQSQIELKAPEGKHIAVVVSTNNSILNITFFAIQLTRISEFADPETGEIIGGKTTILNESDVTLYLPYYANAKEINIYDEDLNKLLTIDVGTYAKESTERKEIVAEKVVLPMEEKKASAREAENIFTIMFIVAAIIIGIIFLRIIIKRYKTNRKEEI